MKDFNSDLFCGTGASRIPLTLSSVGRIPSGDIWWPRNSSVFWKNLHFLSSLSDHTAVTSEKHATD